MTQHNRPTDKIEELCDERSIGNGWFVYLKPGWQYEGAHCFGEDKKADVWKSMKLVKPCGCGECRAGKGWQ